MNNQLRHTIKALWQPLQPLRMLLLALCLLVLAVAQFSLPIKRQLHQYLFIIDITQSMNTQDMGTGKNALSRLAFTKKVLHETIAQLPCNTQVGIGMFSGVNVVALFEPIEVCTHFDAIQDSLNHIDWRMAWTADSRVREGMLASSQLMTQLGDRAQVVFFTDGEEAPKLHAFNTRDLSTLQGAEGWLVVGVGSAKGGPIPRLDANNQLTGYWSHESMQLAPGAAPIAAAGLLQRKSDRAENEQDRYISVLAETHLQKIAQEIGATYLKLKNSYQLLDALENMKSRHSEWSTLKLANWFALIAGLLILWTTAIPKLRQMHFFKKQLLQQLHILFQKVGYQPTWLQQQLRTTQTVKVIEHHLT